MYSQTAVMKPCFADDALYHFAIIEMIPDQLQTLENLYRCEEPQKEEFREFDIYFLFENNNYQQMHYTKSVKTLWNTTRVFFFLYQATGFHNPN